MMPYANVPVGGMVDVPPTDFSHQRIRSTSPASQATTKRRPVTESLRYQVHRFTMPAVGHSETGPTHAPSVYRARDSPHGSGPSTAFPSPQESNMDYSDMSVFDSPQTLYSEYTAEVSEPPSATSENFPRLYPGMPGKSITVEDEDHPPPSSPPVRGQMRNRLTRAACIQKIRNLKPLKRRVAKEPAKIMVDENKPGDQARARNTQCARNSRKRKETYIEYHEVYLELAEEEIGKLQRFVEEKEAIIHRLEEQQGIMRPSMADHSTPTNLGTPSQPNEPRGANLQLLTNPPDPYSAPNLGQDDAVTDAGVTLPPTPRSLLLPSQHVDQGSNEFSGSSNNNQAVHYQMKAQQLQQVTQHTLQPTNGQVAFEEHSVGNIAMPKDHMPRPIEADWNPPMPHGAVTAQQAHYRVGPHDTESHERNIFATSPTLSAESADQLEEGPILPSIEGTGDPYINSDFAEPSQLPNSTERPHNMLGPRAERETSIGTLLNEQFLEHEGDPSPIYYDQFPHQWQTHEYPYIEDQPSQFEIPHEHNSRRKSKDPE